MSQYTKNLVPTMENILVLRYKIILTVLKNLSKILISILFGIMLGIIAYLSIRVYELEQTHNYKIDELNETIEQLEQRNKELEDLTSSMQRISEDIYDVYTEMDKSLKKVVSINKSYKKDLDTFKEREELYDKYDYCIKYNGERTDLTYDQIKYGEDLMKEKGYDPNLLFSIFMVESKATEVIKNPKSSAKGYGQILDSSGHFIYDKLYEGKKGKFKPEYSYDGNTNIEMTVTLLDYLIKKYNNLDRVIMHYSGRDSNSVRWYIKEMNKYSNYQQVAANIY